MQNLQKNIQHCRLVIAEIHEDTPKYHYCLQPKMSKIVKNPDHANIARNNSDKCKPCKKRFRQENSFKH